MIKFNNNIKKNNPFIKVYTHINSNNDKLNLCIKENKFIIDNT